MGAKRCKTLHSYGVMQQSPSTPYARALPFVLASRIFPRHSQRSTHPTNTTHTTRGEKPNKKNQKPPYRNLKIHIFIRDRAHLIIEAELVLANLIGRKHKVPLSFGLSIEDDLVVWTGDYVADVKGAAGLDLWYGNVWISLCGVICCVDCEFRVLDFSS